MNLPTLDAATMDLPTMLAALGKTAGIGAVPPDAPTPLASPTPMDPMPAMPPSMPTSMSPTVPESGMAKALKSLAPLIFAGIAAKQGGPLSSAALLKGMADARQYRDKQQREQAELDARNATTAESARLRMAELDQRKQADALAFRQKTIEGLDAHRNAADRAQYIALSEAYGMKAYGLPTGWLSGLPMPDTHQQDVDDAVGFMETFRKLHPDPEDYNKHVAGDSLVTFQGKPNTPISRVMALTGLGLTDAQGKGLPVPVKAPETSYQRTEVLVNGKRQFANYDPKRGGFFDDNGVRLRDVSPVPPSGATGGNGSSRDDVAQIAAGIVEGNQPPTVTGLYRNGGPVRAELQRRGYNLAKAQEDWEATRKHLASLNSTQQLRLRQAVSFTSDSLDIIETLNKQWKGGRFPLLNRAQLKAAKGGALGPEAQSIATRLEAQISDLVSELGTVYKGGNSSTDDSLALAAKNLQADWSQKTLTDAIAQVRANLQIRRNSMLTAKAVTNVDNVYAPNLGAPEPSGATVGGYVVTPRGAQ
jgi:hypothetical protein